MCSVVRNLHAFLVLILITAYCDSPGWLDEHWDRTAQEKGKGAVEVVLSDNSARKGELVTTT